jgi:hypothetical protein
MIKRRGASQIENLTPNHKPFESKNQMKLRLGMLYIVEKTFLRAIRYCPHILKKDLILEKYECPKF